MENEMNRASSDSYPCPNCGSDMTFNPDTQALFCQYCDTEIPIEKQEGEIFEYDFEHIQDLEKENDKEKSFMIVCENCGAKTVLETNVTAKKCPFCGSSHVANQDNFKTLPPESLIPFQISKEQALSLFKKWLKKKWFAPNKLKEQYRNNELNGIYIPYFTYDSDTFSTYTAQAGTYYYETRTKWVTENGQRKSVTEQVRKIRWRFVSGKHQSVFDDVLINASSNLNDKYMEKIEPFNLSKLNAYDTKFVSGFMAERYGVSVKDGWNMAKSKIDKILNREITRKIHADEVKALSVHTTYDQIKFKHLLLPVWMSTYKYKDKQYKYLVNGETGEVQGSSPVSALKIALAVLIGLIGIVAVYFIIKSYRGY